MGAIGDLFWMFRGEGKQLHVDAKREGAKAGQTIGQHIQAGIKKSWTKGEVGKGLAQGLGFAGALGGAALVTRAVSSVINILGDASQAAMEEQRSIVSLGATLRANIPAWDGNTEAIEKVLAARMKLGFSDDEQRSSLGTLLIAYKDVGKALDAQRVAMDLARFRQISLAEASAAMTKVEGGQFRALKGLGIQVAKNATAEEALLAVRKATAGQANAYLTTDAGKQEAAQKRLGEVMEKLGAIILPMVTNAMVGVAEAAEAVADFFAEVGAHGDNISDFFDDLTGNVNATDRALNGFVDTTTTLKPTLSAAGAGAHTFAVKVEEIGDAGTEAARKVRVSLGDIIAAFKARISEMETISADAGEALYGEIDRRADLSRINREKAEVEANIASGKLRGADLEDARQKLRDLTREQLAAISRLAIHGEASEKELTSQIGALIKSLNGATERERAAIMRLIAALNQASVAAANVARGVGAAGDRGGSGRRAGGGGRAAGGPVWPGGTFTVGERGPETFVPMVPGKIVPNAQSSGAGHTFHLHYPEPHAAEDIVRAQRRMAVVGL